MFSVVSVGNIPSSLPFLTLPLYDYRSVSSGNGNCDEDDGNPNDDSSGTGNCDEDDGNSVLSAITVFPQLLTVAILYITVIV